MPKVEDLSEKERKAFLGCIAAKTEKWRKLYPSRDEIPKVTMDRFFRSCAKKLGHD